MNTLFIADKSARAVSVESQVEQVLDAVRIQSGMPLTGKVAKLVAALPFLAECSRPERASLHNLIIYAAALSGPVHQITNHGPADDANAHDRIAPMCVYNGGDSRVLAHGDALLDLVLLEGYRRDIAKDTASGEYNPLVSGAWDYDAVAGELLEKMETNWSDKVERWLPLRDVRTVNWL